MPLFARMMFVIVSMRARRGLSSPDANEFRAGQTRTEESEPAAKHAARRAGVRGETYVYRYLRRHGYVIVSRNFTVPGVKGEIDLAGYDGKVLAFIEMKTLTSDAHENAENGAKRVLPEDAMTGGKRHNLVRIAHMFMTEWRIKDGACRFDMLAVESQPGKSPVVRLHKDCFGISGNV